MSTLAEVQRAVQAFVLGGNGQEAAALIEPDGLDPARCLQVYRNHFQLSFREALAAVYSVVRRLVDPRFFAWLAHEYLSEHPPRDPRLCAFGGRLPEFIEGFPPCRDLPYLSDVARLEWALHEALHAADEPSLSPAAFAALCASDPSRLRLRIRPGVRYVRSALRIDALWLAHQDEKEPSELKLIEQPMHLQVRCLGDEVGFREIPAEEFVLRSALLAGATLEAAAEDALSVTAGLNLPAALEAVFSEGLVTGIASP